MKQLFTNKMSKASEFLGSIFNNLRNHPKCISNSFLIVLSTGGERLFSFTFECPNNIILAKCYGWIFLLAPFFTLLIAGIVLNNNCWRVFLGCGRRSVNTQLRRKDYCRSFTEIFFQTLIVPCTWLFVSLMDGDYFACLMAWGPDDTTTTPEGKYVWKDTEGYLLMKKCSQITAWFFLFVALCIGSIVTCYRRFQSKRTYFEARYADMFRRLEEEELDAKMAEITTQLVSRNVNLLLNSGRPDKETWDKMTMVVDETKDGTYFSPLHKWGSEEFAKMLVIESRNQQQEEENGRQEQQTEEVTTQLNTKNGKRDEGNTSQESNLKKTFCSVLYKNGREGYTRLADGEPSNQQEEENGSQEQQTEVKSSENQDLSSPFC